MSHHLARLDGVAENVAVSDVSRDALAHPSMGVPPLAVEPHPSTADPILPSPLLFLDLTFEIFLSVVRPIDEALHKG
jgi:hypothetical protein